VVPMEVSVEMRSASAWMGMGQAEGVRALFLSQAVALSCCDYSVWDLGWRERAEGGDSGGVCDIFVAFLWK
jgi:hypothetical protein